MCSALVRRAFTFIVTLVAAVAFATSAMAISAGCAAVNAGGLNSSGQAPSLLQTNTILGGFYPGDTLNLRYTQNPAKAGVLVTLAAVVLSANLSITTSSTDTLITQSATVSVLGGIGANATVVDPSSVLTPRTNYTLQVTCTAAGAPTTLTVTSAGSTTYGQAAAFTATMNSAFGTPTGYVEFSLDGVAQQLTPLSSGKATINPSSLAAGSHTVSARYISDGNFAASTGSLLLGHTVFPAAINLAFSSSANPAAFGVPVTLTATATTVSPGQGTPVGNVTFYVFGYQPETRALVNGTATLTTTGLPAGSYYSTAHFEGSQNFATNLIDPTLNQVITKAATTTTVTGPGVSTVQGQAATFRATVGTAGALIPAGNVVFTINGQAKPAIALNSSGFAELSLTDLPIGATTVSAEYFGNTNYAGSTGSLAVNHQVTVRPTSTVVTGSGITFGQSASITATVSATAGGGTPTGTVTFSIDDVPQSTPVALVNGIATVSIPGLSAGSHKITAAYGGAAIFGASSGELSGRLSVSAAATTTTVTTSAASFGQDVTVTAHVASTAGTPTGQVVFTVDGGAPRPAVTLSGGDASIVLSGLSVGPHTVVASYAAQGNFDPSSGTTSNFVVGKANASLVVTSSADPSVKGQPVTFTATATSTAGTPAGDVTFTVGGTPHGPITLNAQGVATYTATDLTVGSATVSAAYAGNGNFNGVTASLPGVQTIQRGATSVVVSSSKPTTAMGESVTFTATVAATAPATGTPSGSVIFTIDGAVQPAVTLSGGVATLTRANLDVGTRTIGVLYSGDLNFAASSAATISQTVQKGTTSIALTATPPSPHFGDTATVTATVTATPGVATGNVIFTVNGIDQTVALAGGVATISLPNLPVGTQTISARYEGTTTYDASSTTAPTVITVTPAVTTTTVSALPMTGRLGETVTVTATVSGTGTPGGTVTFRDGATVLDTVTVSGGSASYTSAGLSLGSHTITATYSGDANHAGSAGTLTPDLVIGKGIATLQLSANPTQVSFGQPVTVTVTASGPNNGVPTGNVTITAGGVDHVVALTNGTGSVVISDLAPGANVVTAAYAGSTSYLAATATLSGGIAVTRAATSMSLDSTPASPRFGDTVTITAKVESSAGTPGGLVTFTVAGAGALAPVALDVNGIASVQVSGLAAGSHAVSASYAATTNFQGTTATLSSGIMIGAATPGIDLSASPAAPVYGQGVTLTASLTSTAGPVTGNVVFVVDNVDQAPVQLSGGTATLTVNGLGVGTHDVAVKYAAQGNFGTVTKSLDNGVTVIAAASSTSVTGSATPEVGLATTYTATVSSTGGTPTGSVAFAIDGVVKQTVPLNNGTASASLTFASAGSHAVTASYLGNHSFGPSTGSQSVVVDKATTDTAVLQPLSYVYGDPAGLNVEVTATVSADVGTPTGTVVFLINGAPVGSAPLVNGVAKLALPPQQVGSYDITAQYQGSMVYEGSATPQHVTLEITAASMATQVSLNPTSIQQGNVTQVTVTTTATGPSAIPGEGSVTVTAGAETQTATLINGTATVTIGSSLAAGTSTITASVTPSGNFTAPADATATLTVTAPPAQVTLSAVLPQAVVGVAYSGKVTAFGGTGGFTYALSNGTQLPAGLNLDANTGVITGTPTTAGTTTFQITATDSSLATGVYNSAPFTVLAQPVFTPPPPLADATYGVAYSASIADGTKFASYAIVGGALPPGMELTADGTIRGTPTQLGTVTIQVKATDSNGLSDTATVSFNVIAPTIAVSATFADATVGASYNVAPVVTGGVGPYSFTLGSNPLPPGLSLNPGTGVVSGIPTADGTYGFTITARDANGFTGDLAGQIVVDAAPVLILPATLGAARQGQAFAQSLAPTGGAGPFTYTVIGTLPDGLSLNLSTGLLSGKPVSGGEFDFGVSVTNGTLNGSRTYHMSIAEAADLVPNTSIPGVIAGVNYNHQLVVDGSNGATLTFVQTSGTLPTGISLTSGGLLSGTPTVPGNYSFSIEISNPDGDSVVASYVLNVTAPVIDVAVSDLSGEFNQPFSGTISVTGGGTFTYGVTGTLPTGVSFSGDTISGVPTEAGSFQLTVTATNASGFVGTSNVTLVIDPPAITFNGLSADGKLGDTISGSISATSTAGLTFAYAIVAGDLPTGVTLDPDGSLSGQFGGVGSFNFTVEATADTYGFKAQQQFTIVVATNVGTIGFVSSLPPAVAGQPIDVLLPTTSVPANTTFTISPSGTGLSVDSNGRLTGTRTDAQPITFTVTATTPDGFINTASYTLTVEAPTFQAGAQPGPAVAGTFYSATLTASGGSGTLTYSTDPADLPAGLTLAADGTLDGTPTASGTFNFVVTVEDENGFTAALAYSITVAAPSITLDDTLPDAQMGQVYPGGTVTATGGAAPYTYAVTAGNLPAPMQLAANGAVTGTPADAGTYVFTITATDANGFTGSRAYSLTVASNQGTATFNSDPPNGTFGIAYPGTWTVTTGGGTYTYAITGGALPPELDINAAGEITGIPKALGTFSFVVTVTDGNGLINSQAFSLTIQAPVITVTPPSTGNAVQNTPFTATITGSGGAAPYTYAIHSPPPGLDIDPGTGVISGTPTTAGTFNYSVSVTDANGFSTVLNLTLVVAPEPIDLQLPPAQLADATQNSLYSASVAASNGAPPVTYVNVGPLPAGLGLDGTTGIISGTPTAAGAFSFSITATDAQGNTKTQTFDLTINAPPAQPVTSSISISAPSSAQVGESVTIGVTVSGNGGTPSGTVTVTDTGTGSVVGTGTLDGSGAATVTVGGSTAAGTTTYGIAYSGDTSFAPSSTTSSVNVTAAATNVQIVTNGAIDAGEPLVVVINVTRAAPASGPVDGGKVVVTVDGGTPTERPVTGGSANFALTLEPGNHTIVATYVPANGNDQGQSSQVSVSVSTGTSMSLAVPSADVTEGAQITLKATIAAQGGTTLPTGQVEFFNGATSLGVANIVNGEASYAFTPTAGTYSITARYAGDSHFAATQAGPASFTVVPVVGPVTYTMDLTISPPTPQIGEQVTITATLTPPGARGTVTFTNNTTGETLATVPIDRNGQAQIQFALMSSGVTVMASSYVDGNGTVTETISINPGVAQTSVLLTTSAASVQSGGTVQLVATVSRQGGGAPEPGQVQFLAGNQEIATVPTNNVSVATVTSPAITSDTVFTANFIPGAPTVDAPSSDTATVAVSDTPVAEAAEVEASAGAIMKEGQPVRVTFHVIAEKPLTGLRLTSTQMQIACPRTSLNTAETMDCSGAYIPTESDVARGGVQVFATLLADGEDPVAVSVWLGSVARTLVDTFETLTDDFVSTRFRLLANGIRTPNVHDRLRGSSQIGTIRISDDGENQILAFSTSLAEVNGFAAANAARELGWSSEVEPLPLNIWIDVNMALHARVNGANGHFITAAGGVDYLVTDDLLVGAMVQGDWMTHVDGNKSVDGAGILAGPYVSIALGENLTLDATVLYGSSSNSARVLEAGDLFSGTFDTTRIVAKGKVTGFIDMDLLSVRPNATFVLASETADAFQVTNSAGDTFTVPGEEKLSYEVGIGTTIEYRLDLDNGAVLTPRVGGSVGLAGELGSGIDLTGAFSVGLGYRTANGLSLNGGFDATIDSTGLMTGRVSGSISGRF